MGKTFKTPVVATTLMREEVEHLARRKRPGGFNLDMQTAIPVFGYFGATIPLRAPMLATIRTMSVHRISRYSLSIGRPWLDAVLA